MKLRLEKLAKHVQKQYNDTKLPYWEGAMDVLHEFLDTLEAEEPTPFDRMDWIAIAETMGGTVTRRESHEVEVAIREGTYIIEDNGGEFNISKTVDACDYSVPYTSAFEDVIEEEVLGYRLLCAIKGEEIDYDFRINSTNAELAKQWTAAYIARQNKR